MGFLGGMSSKKMIADASLLQDEVVERIELSRALEITQRLFLFPSSVILAKTSCGSATCYWFATTTGGPALAFYSSYLA